MSTVEQDKMNLLKLVDRYAESICKGDFEMAKEVFAISDELTLLHPRGHEHGIKGIEDFYRITMVETFTERSLELTNKPEVYVYGDTAVVEFYWNFIATMRDNGERLESGGRETQVLVRQADKTWKIMHIHYSAMPVTGRGEGF